MSSTGSARRVQQRAIDTQDALLDTAVESFSRQGYEGVSVRSIEEQAGVNRGLVAYHFGDKAELWRCAVARLFEQMSRVMAEAAGERPQDDGDLARRLARAFVRYSAEHPALNRLMMQESMQSSWRVEHLVESEIRPMLQDMKQRLPKATGAVWGDLDPHRYYIFIGAAAFAFSAAEECRVMFGRSPDEEEFVERHADLVLELLFPPTGPGTAT